MTRPLLALAAGYFSITFINSLNSVIVAVYFQTEINLTGISHLPSPGWALGITFLQLFLGMFGGLLVSTIAGDKAPRVITAFILLMVIVGLINYSMLSASEPLWHLIAAPLLQVTGIYGGYYLQQSQLKTDTAGYEL